MGYRILLLGVKGRNEDALYKDLGVKLTDRSTAYAEYDVQATPLDTGYHLLYIKDKIDPEDTLFQKLSQGGELYGLYIHENMMVSFICYWKNGQESWSVLHNCQEGVEHLVAKEDLPEDFEALKAEKLAMQKGVIDVDHIFEIPNELFSSRVGFIYYRPKDSIKSYQILERV